MPHTDDSFGQYAEVKTYLYQLVYSSVLKQSLTQSQTNALVENAQRANQAAGITGILMMDDGIVVQWLEGNKAAVRALWARLQHDPRHHCIVELLHREYQGKRLYPDWSMHQASLQDMLASCTKRVNSTTTASPTHGHPLSTNCANCWTARQLERRFACLARCPR